MKLYNVRKGQFVYFNNELHRVYSVKPFFKKSIHLIRLKDLEQHITEAKYIERYKPQHLDSFIYNRKRYTLHNDKRADKGDYILIMKPTPDSLDHYALHSIEEVSDVEQYGVISNKSNGIKHNEYWLLMPGREDGSKLIDVQNTEDMEDTDLDEEASEAAFLPDLMIGDVYQRVNGDVKAMVVAVQGDTVVLGGDLELTKKELADSEKWKYIYNLLDQ
ncbi:hypothetical protein [Tuberibacillus sp. Marseille-P3662]|uniref:hypothetical protein n=1 Tax=Tuberibacillus sp. Marseille-P3662 TaxID=1965358 RepID=UPI000A1CAA15|nr:hypothetical protein [Tuberibacillus sp. Marseille-P3662]